MRVRELIESKGDRDIELHNIVPKFNIFIYIMIERNVHFDLLLYLKRSSVNEKKRIKIELSRNEGNFYCRSICR